MTRLASRVVVMIVAVVVLRAESAVAQATQRTDVSVWASVDRTALFIGDRVTYTIELTCGRGVELLTDDLSGDKLNLDGLDLVASDHSSEPGRDGSTIHRFRYVLTTYRVEGPMLKLAPMAARYARARPGQRIEDAVPAGEVQIPGQAIALRSVLPGEAARPRDAAGSTVSLLENVAGIRHDRAASVRPTMFAMLQPVGIGLFIVAIVPMALAAAAVVRRRRVHAAKPPRRSARAARQVERASLEGVRAIDLGSLDGRRDAFARLDALVREHVRDVCGLPGPCLTSTEIASALSSRTAWLPAEVLTSVLVMCERGRYAPPHAMPSADACRQTINDVEQVMGM